MTKLVPTFIPFIVITLACLVAITLRLVSPSPARISGPTDPVGFESGWSAIIRTEGAAQAYKEFKSQYIGDAGTGTHTAAHLFGDALYKAMGVRALQICDSAFSYGCYHQVMADLLLQNGPQQLEAVSVICSEQANDSTELPCYHGVGHGLAEYYGENLTAALSGCSSFAKDVADSCAAGVFMQYDEPIVGGDGASYADVDPADLYKPCDSSLPEAFVGACYLALPARLADTKLSIQKIIEVCGSAPLAYRNFCYQGVGIQVPGFVLYDQQKVVSVCETIPSVQGTLACRQEAAQTLRSFSKDADLVDPKS
jgi:hypothetical protein